ncbi:hypothetical protein Tco_0800390 [Tanacetum coccineum]|uniref:Uncharacterized protein n=1 Tax=Tanacetum coccineum TaxID=301880 RepID=A0ABQ4ZTZ3_9ASTR
MAHSSSRTSSSSGSDIKVSTYTQECLKSYNTLKEHYDNLVINYRKSHINVASYQVALESVEERLEVYRKNETIYEENIKSLNIDVKLRDKVLVQHRQRFETTKKERDKLKLKLEKFQNSSKNLNNLLDSQVSANNKSGLGFDNQVGNKNQYVEEKVSQDDEKNKSGEGYHVVPPPFTRNFMPPKPDLVLDDTNEYVFTKSATSVPAVVPKVEASKEKHVSVRKDISAPINEELVSYGKKKTIFPTVSKIEFVRPKQLEKLVRKLVKYAEIYRLQRPRGNQRNWNN